MHGRPLLFVGAALVLALIWFGQKRLQHRPFPPDTTPEGAYARVAFDIAEGRPRETFAYVETEAQWAAYTIRDMRKRACGLVRAHYPAAERQRLLAAWQGEADAPDGADVYVLLATGRGWFARLERDLSGVAHVEIRGERATVVTARGTRYPFRRRDNGIWGLTGFTAELEAEAERAARDLEVVERDAADYARAGATL
ncbi:MAG: hypothetical protein JOZ69_19780 [Myxococcales bacterium]|nr:hypothetical protein [Myxococcales bacterium]